MFCTGRLFTGFGKHCPSPYSSHRSRVDEPHGSLFAYFRIFAPLADNHVIASHVTGITQPIPTFTDHFRSFATISDHF